MASEFASECAAQPPEHNELVPMRHPAEFWRKVLDLVEAGRPMAEIVEKLGVSSQTIYDWRDQDLVDRGLSPAVTTAGR